MGGRRRSPTFVGRQAELGTLETALDEAGSRQPRVVLLGGEAGIGKTRLLEQFASAARRRAIVLSGSCVPLLAREIPFLAITEVLRDLARQAQSQPLLQDAPAELSELSAALGGRGGLSSGDGSPLVMFELVLRLLGNRAERVSVTLVVEDAHWADRSTLDLLAFLVRNLRDERVLLIVSYRSEVEAVRMPPAWSAELGRWRGVERITLGRLTRSETGAQLQGILGAVAPSATVERIHRRSEGNPFFSEQLLAADRTDGATDLPDTLREVLAGSLHGLSWQAGDLIEAVATCGPTVDEDLIAAVSKLEPGEFRVALRELVDRGLLTRHGDGDQFAFRHALVQEAVVRGLLASERRQLHAAAATALTARSTAESGSPATVAATLAYHWVEAGEDDRALVASVEAGAGAERVHAAAEAGKHFARAVGICRRRPELESRLPCDQVELLARLGEATLAVGDVAAAGDAMRQAIDRVDPADDPVRAGLLLSRYGEFLADGQLDDALAVRLRAVELVRPSPPTVARARVVGECAGTLMLLARHEESSRLCDEAIATARGVGGVREDAVANVTLGINIAALGDPERGIAVMQGAAETLESLEDPQPLAWAWANLSDDLMRVGRLEEAADLARKGVERCREVGLLYLHGCAMRANGAEALHLLGRWNDVLLLVDDGLAGDAPASSVMAHLFVRAQIRTARGEFAGAEADLDAARSLLGDRSPQYVCALELAQTELALAIGDLDTARRHVDAAAEEASESDDPIFTGRVAVIGVAVEAEIVDRAGASEPRRGEARRRATVLAECGRAACHRQLHRAPPTGTEAAANLALIEAELGRALGRHGAAGWDRAVATWDAWGVPYRAAYARMRLAACTGAPGGETRLREAHAMAEQLAATPLLEKLAKLADRAGLVLPRPKDKVSSLTLVPTAATPARAESSLAAEFNVLGSLEVIRGGRPIALPGRRMRTLVCLFLLHPNQTLTLETLADALWGARVSHQVRKRLHVAVLRLRRTLGPLGPDRALRTHDAGYRLEVPMAAIDANRFEAALTRGRRLRASGAHQAAVDALVAADDLWRGPALEDVALESFAQGEIRRLEELRMVAVEERVEAQLELGLHREMVPDLQRLTGAHPAREDLRRQLMIALYRCGRQSDALAQYVALRRALQSELGLEPSPRLRDLEHAILNHEPALLEGVR